MAKKETIKLRIPGSKKEIEVPRWAAFAVGGAALLAVIFMRDNKPSGSDGDGLLASEMAQRLEEQRQWFGTALGDVAARVEEISVQGQEELFEPTTPAARGNGKKDEIPQYQYIPGEGQLEVGTVQFLTAEPTGADRELTRAEQTYAERLQAIAEGYASGKIIGTAGGTPVVTTDTVAKVVSAATEPAGETAAQRNARLQEQFDAGQRARLIEMAEEDEEPYNPITAIWNAFTEPEVTLTRAQQAEADRWQAMADHYQ